EWTLKYFVFIFLLNVCINCNELLKV
uniref:Uncharacterized protein n=1 Tax=Amphimedon queenslandica TaxID=400682 RepID=A0A1X7TAH5_AMPQE